jgi:peptidyl-dipeptidase A
MKPFIILFIFCFTITTMSIAMQNDEQELRAFIDNHVKIVEPKLKAMNLASWNASATGEKKYYDEQAATELDVRTIYSNKQEFAQLKKWKDSGNIKDTLLCRQLILLYNSYLTNQIDSMLMRKIVEKSAAIANKFNTFRGALDGKEVSDNEIDDILQKETDSARRQKTWEASKMVGKAVAPMLIELVKLRNKAARQLGYKNFYEMSLIAAEQSESEIVTLFDELAALTDAPFKTLKADIDTKLANKWGIKASEMKPWHYQDRFFQESPQVSNVDLDQYFKDKKVEDLAKIYYTQLDLPVDNIVKNSDLYGRTGKYQHAFETDIDRRGDIRVMLSIVNNQYWMSTILHELGHAAYSNNVRRDLPFLLRSETHIFFTEAIAMMMERQASNADWLSAMVGIPDSEKNAIRKAGEESLRMHGLIFSRWTQVMMRFERAMYQNPDQDLNKLWWDLVEQYQLIKRPEGRNEPDWAAKIHLSQSPVYYHNYELGELTASQLQHYIAVNVLKQTDTKNVCFANKPAVGDYLKTRVFMPGASLRWDELMKYATDEPLTAKYFAEEFVK